MKKLLAKLPPRDIAGLFGVALMAYGAWRVYAPAGYIVAGAFLVVGALLDARSRVPERQGF